MGAKEGGIIYCAIVLWPQSCQGYQYSVGCPGITVLGPEVFLCCVGSRGVPVLGLEVFLCWV